MPPKLERATVRDALDPIAVAQHCGIESLRWAGRWARSRRCAETDHSTTAFAVSRDGMWHCFGCGTGGDLFALIAIAERLDVKADFPKVLTIAAEIAGIDAEEEYDDFGPPPSKAQRLTRAAPPPMPELGERISKAATSATWLWDRLSPPDRASKMYLESRGLLALPPHAEIRATPLRMSKTQAEQNKSAMTIFRMWGIPGIAVPVRHVETGTIVDVRCRRYEVSGDEPKVIGMLGGVTTHNPDGKGAELVACYGNPHKLSTGIVIVVEGLADTLTAMQIWPDFDVLGAVDAAQYPLVAGFAADYCARSSARLVLVAQHDHIPVDDPVSDTGAADKAVDKAATRALFAGVLPAFLECNPHKDLNRWHVTGRGESIARLKKALDDSAGKWIKRSGA